MALAESPCTSARSRSRPDRCGRRIAPRPRRPSCSRPRAEEAVAKPKSPLSAALRDSDLILDLLAFELSGWIGVAHALGLRRDIVPNLPGTSTGFALNARLTEPAPTPENLWDFDSAEAFRAFRETGAEHARAELVRHLAGLLTSADAKLGALIDVKA